MRNLRIAHIADTHLGYKSSSLTHRDEDFANSWLFACKAIVDSSPDLIIHAGDVFHSARPDWKALTAYTTGVGILLRAGVPVFIIAGNHDTSALNLSHTVFTFTSGVLPRVVATNDDTPSAYPLDDLNVDVVLVPHRALLDKAVGEHVYHIVENLENHYRILVSHGSISKDDPSSELGSVAIPHSITEHDWSYVALGHLHISQPYGPKGWYSGSTERCGWSDYSSSPAWTMVELRANGTITRQQRSVPAMPMIQLPDVDCELETDEGVVDRVLYSLTKVVIPPERTNIRVRLTHLPYHRKRRVTNVLQRSVREKSETAVFSVVVDTDQSLLNPTEYSPIEVYKGLKEHFIDFVDEQDYDADFKSRFLARGQELLEEGARDDETL